MKFQIKYLYKDVCGHTLMFIGHFGLGLASKGVDKRPSLGTMFIAVQWLDLLWPVLLLTGVEKFSIVPGNTVLTPLRFDYYPWSHSMLIAMAWGVLFAVVYLLVTKNGRSAVLMGFLVFSHWVLDWITHTTDLQITPFSETRVGLGLWNYKWAAIIIELAIFISGALVYLKVTRAKNTTGRWVIWTLLIFLLVIHLMNIVGPPPNNVNAVAWVGLSQWLLVAWAYWADSNRSPAFT